MQGEHNETCGQDVSPGGRGSLFMLGTGDPDQYEGVHRSDATMQSSIPTASLQSSLKQSEQLEGGLSRQLTGLGAVKTVEALFSFRR